MEMGKTTDPLLPKIPLQSSTLDASDEKENDDGQKRGVAGGDRVVLLRGVIGEQLLEPIEHGMRLVPNAVALRR
jgi:hypothetical protein